MSNKSSSFNRRDFLSLAALAAATASKTATASPLFDAFLFDSTLAVGFAALDRDRLQDAENISGENLGPSVRLFLDGNADDESLENVDLTISYPHSSPFKAWSYGGYPIAGTSAPTSFIVPQKYTNGLELRIKVKRNGKKEKHKILIGHKASEKGLRPGHYALLLAERNPKWRNLTLQNLPAHILLTVELAGG